MNLRQARAFIWAFNWEAQFIKQQRIDNVHENHKIV